MTEEHKEKIAEMVMKDYDIRPSLAYLIVKCFIDSVEQIIREDSEIINAVDKRLV